MDGGHVLVSVLFSMCLNHILSAPTIDPHGGVKMGVINKVCDDAHSNLGVDWNNSTNYEYTCQKEETTIPVNKNSPVLECIPRDEMPQPLHKCMRTEIRYEDVPPRGGPHRPLWPVYGEYIYAPPQRWIHTLEHGGVVFLYHPCAETAQIEAFKFLGRGCLRKHVITPYRKMPLDKMFAVVTYGCRLMMGQVNAKAIVKYVRERALTAPERTAKEGQYSYGLLETAALVSDFEDSGVLCPDLPKILFQEEQNELLPEEGIDHLQKRLGRRVIM